MLLDTVKTGIVAAVKSGDQVKAGTYRFFLAAIRNFAIAKYGSAGEAALTEEDIIEVAKKQVKSRRESIAAYLHAGRQDLAQKENQELELLAVFVPQSLDETEIEKEIRAIVAQNPGLAFGPLMGLVMSKLKGKAEGAIVSRILKKVIAS